MSKPVLYIDVDDTLIAQHYDHLGFDLRPYAMSQLHFLTGLFECKWLTCVSQERIEWLMRCLYATHIRREFEYCDWGTGHPDGKAGYVLAPGQPEDFWWLEDPLCLNEQEALKRAGKQDRWIRVNPKGPDGFTEAIKDLLRRSGHEDKVCAIPGTYSIS